MDPEHISQLGQAIFWAGTGIAGLVVAISYALGNLFKSMGSGYGGVIAALQIQNTEQQKEIKADHEEIIKLRTSHAACMKKHEDCEQKQNEQQGQIKALQDQVQNSEKALADLRKELIHRGEISDVVHGMQDVSVKVDEAKELIKSMPGTHTHQRSTDVTPHGPG
jgi:uncharacterized protein HemX